MRKHVAVATLLGREGGLYTAQFAPDGQHVLSPGPDGLLGGTLKNLFFWAANVVLEQCAFIPFELFDVSVC